MYGELYGDGMSKWQQSPMVICSKQQKPRSNARTICTRNITREMAQTEISEGVKLYLDNLFHTSTLEIKTSTLELKNEIESLKALVNEKNAKITELSEQVVNVVKRNVELSSEVATMREELHLRMDDMEQRSRKINLRLEGIEIEDGETNDILTGKIVKALNSLGAKVSSDDIFRCHRSGKTISRNGKKIAQSILSFRSWAARTRAFDTRYDGSFDERKKRPFFVRHDLTKRRQQLLKYAQDQLYNHPDAHVYANRECNMLLKNRSSGKLYAFNDMRDLHDALSALQHE